VFNVSSFSEDGVHSRDREIEKLIAGLADGDIEALDELYRLISTDIYAYALSRTVSRENAEDITHDTFVQIYKNAKLYKARGKPMAWIITIELNLIRRRANLDKRVTELDDSVGVEIHEDFSEKIINSEFLRYVMRILDTEEREIISLHIVSGLKHREIAALLNKPLSTVLSKYNRALKKLQAEVGKKEVTGEKAEG